MAAPAKRGPSAFILALLTELSSASPLREEFTLLPLAQASGRYERPSGRKRPLPTLSAPPNSAPGCMKREAALHTSWRLSWRRHMTRQRALALVNCTSHWNRCTNTHNRGCRGKNHNSSELIRRAPASIMGVGSSMLRSRMVSRTGLGTNVA